MDGVSCAPLLPVNLVSRGKRDAMINALFQNNMYISISTLVALVPKALHTA
jgi:hypothetical protein